MARYVEDVALVLRRVDYGEADVIVDLLTQKGGRTSVFARSARKSTRRFTGGLGPFSCLGIQYRPGRESALGTLQKSECVEYFEGIVEEHLRLAAGAWLISLVEAITQPTMGADPFFSYIVTILRWLSTARSPSHIACGMLRAELVLLQDAGVLAAMDSCQRTGRPLEELNEAMFCPGVGLIGRDVRASGEQGTVLKRASIELLQAVLERRMVNDVTGDALHPLREGLRDSWAEILDRLPRTWRTWDGAIRAAIP